MLHAVLSASESSGSINPLLPELPDLIWSAFCFAVIFVFFWKLALPRMKKLLDERAEAIEGNIAKADEAQRKAEEMLEDYTAQLADARAEAARIREQARVDGRKILEEFKEQASREAERVTATAQAQIEAERQAAVVSLRSEVGSLAIDLASGVIGEALTDDVKSQAIVDRFLADLEADETSKAGTGN